MVPKTVMPGIVGERSRQFLQLEDPLDMEMELATARAILSLEAERYGLDHEAAIEAQKTGTPHKNPDAKGVIEALKLVDKIATNIQKLKLYDAVPSERMIEIFLEVRRSMQAVCAEHKMPELAEAIEQSWQNLVID